MASRQGQRWRGPSPPSPGLHPGLPASLWGGVGVSDGLWGAGAQAGEQTGPWGISGVVNRAIMRPEHLGPNQEQTRRTQAGPRVPGWLGPLQPPRATPCPPFPRHLLGSAPLLPHHIHLLKIRRGQHLPLFCPQLGPGAPATPTAHGRQDTGWGAGRGSCRLPLASCWGLWEVGTATVKALSALGRTRMSAPPAATLCRQGGVGGAPSSPGHSPDLPRGWGTRPSGHLCRKGPGAHTRRLVPGRAGSVRAGAAPRGLGLGPSPPGAAGGLGLGGSGPAHT